MYVHGHAHVYVVCCHNDLSCTCTAVHVHVLYIHVWSSVLSKHSLSALDVLNLSCLQNVLSWSVLSCTLCKCTCTRIAYLYIVHVYTYMYTCTITAVCLHVHVHAGIQLWWYSCIIVESSVFTWQWLKYLGHNQNVSDNIWLKINLSISQGELVADICKVSRKHIHILTTAGDCCQVKSSQTIGQNTSAAGSRETKTTDVQCIQYIHMCNCISP